MTLTPRGHFIPYATLAVLLASGGLIAPLAAHESTRPHLLIAQATPITAVRPTGPVVPLKIDLLLDDSRQPIAGLVRITAVTTGKSVELPAHLGRPMGWFSLDAGATMNVPPGDLKIEACHGLETAIAAVSTHAAESTAKPNRVQISLRRFYDHAARRLVGANTHLHLQFSPRPVAGAVLRTRAEAEEYLRTMGRSDGLDLVYVSHLNRVGDDHNYISNQFTRDDLRRWSDERLRFINGEEHRHEGGRATRRGGPDELRYGHILFLDLPQLVQPVSYGAIFAPEIPPTDAVPMRRAIREAHAQQATVVWCHGKQGTEDVPNWIDGLLHAQNIFDGGSDGTFETIFYPYLNAGFRVPFSTGTDWGSYDFSRVYVPLEGERSSRAFLQALAQGRSFITNGPLLEFTVDDRASGDTLALPATQTVRLRARVVGRDDFVRLEVVFNGNVVQRADSRRKEDHFEASLDESISISEPGWLALRIPKSMPYNDRSGFTGAGANLFGKALFAHTSPVYVTVGGKSIRQPAALDQLTKELELAIRTISDKGAFANEAERDALLAIYRSAMEKLRRPN